jgi:hypothetical protein
LHAFYREEGQLHGERVEFVLQADGVGFQVPHPFVLYMVL